MGRPPPLFPPLSSCYSSLWFPPSPVLPPRLLSLLPPCLSVSPLLPLPFCPFYRSFGDTIPWGEVRGKDIVVVPPHFSFGIWRPSFPHSSKDAPHV